MLRKAKPSERTESLAAVPLFATCTPEELEQIAGFATDLAVREGQVLCTEGSFGHEFFVLTDGFATVASSNGAATTVGPGAFFGELALLDHGPRTATVTMTSAGSVLVLSGTEFRTLLHTVPTIAVRMLPVLGARLREAGVAHHG